MNPRRHPRVSPVFVLVVLTVLAGCSMLPTRPTTVQHSATSTRLIQAPIDEPGNDLGTLPADPISTSENISGLVGGNVRAGRFSVVIPPCAIRGNAIVTVMTPDSTGREVDLSITPSGANGFDIPVMLTADMKGILPPELMRYSAMQWYSPATGTWQHVVGSEADSITVTVTAPLRHFSQYRVAIEGRASW